MKEIPGDLENCIAIIGMGCKVPDAEGVEAFWQNLLQGKESVYFLSDQELIAHGVDPVLVNHPQYVKACVRLSEKDYFAADFFGISPREAELMDPQQRLLLECAYHTLEHAGYAPDQKKYEIGVYVGADVSSYFVQNLLAKPDLFKSIDQLQWIYTNSSVATQIAYRLGLTGPSLDVNTACSTSLVAVHLACRSLLFYECDMALAGGASVQSAPDTGYLYTKDSILSSDGHCRAFDEKASGTVPGQGVGLVLLKRFVDAVQDGDQIYALIRSSAINNDGRNKVGYTAPSVEGQVAVIKRALALAEIDPETVSYIECHGTGTTLGDPIELTALKESYRFGPGKHSPCYLGSLKTNMGHLNSAAGVAGLIKTALALHHKTIPASLHFNTLTQKADLSGSNLYVNAELREWVSESGTPRRAGLSSFGIGGTNAHIILEEYHHEPVYYKADNPVLIVLSARTQKALNQKRLDFADFLDNLNENQWAIACYTANTGRATYSYRYSLVVDQKKAAIEHLRMLDEAYFYNIEEDASEWDNLAQRWQAGEQIDWQYIYQHCNYPKMAIPLYPFEREYFWLSEKRPDSGQTKEESSIEAIIQRIWSEVLGIEKIGLNDNFFDLGGHSLLAIQINARIYEELGLELPLVDLLNQPTIAGTLEAILKQQLANLSATEIESILKDQRGSL